MTLSVRFVFICIPRYKEYRLQDYNTWFLKELNNTHNWKHLQTFLVKADDCSNLSKRFKTLKQYELAKLTPIEAGCFIPPSVYVGQSIMVFLRCRCHFGQIWCGYPAVNASYYDLTFHPNSSNKDCILYKNRKPIKCYNYDSSK
uniref:Uncharacterized protein n=1 Tax=Lactuca sativa TaxID=4236 RepID=A0A9R1UFW8_LACSA|nr:hypothetical protein LSAT_V11C900471750 [Lactuca sativa]